LDMSELRVAGYGLRVAGCGLRVVNFIAKPIQHIG
jgi:hypothetical protein